MIKTLCIGEILWDIFPDKKVWGGAPANFIFHTAEFGADATAYSAIGQDELGDELLEAVSKTGIKLVAERLTHPTGKVDISLDSKGVANYEFNESCAWDHLPLNQDLISLSQNADLIAFGTLAQRSKVSRNTILKAIQLKKVSCKVLFDINLRSTFYDKKTIEKSLFYTDFLKLNEEEIVILEDLLAANIQQIISTYKLELIILTLGAEGSKIITSSKSYEHPAVKCKVIDTVGAGDSFTASFIINYLKGSDISEAQKLASKVAAYVCEHKGATVSIPSELKPIAEKELQA